jgi:hypothetical protein
VSDREREIEIEAIVKVAREARPRNSRTMWIAGLVIGAICIAAFVAIFAVDGGSSSTAPVRVRENSRFATGIAIGVAVGIAIGYALARRKQA